MFYLKFCAGLYHWFRRIDDMPKFYTWSASSVFVFFSIVTLLNFYELFTGREHNFSKLALPVGLSLMSVNALLQYFSSYEERKGYSQLATQIIFFGTAILYLITTLLCSPGNG